MHTEAFYILTLGGRSFCDIIHVDTHLIHISPQSDIKTLSNTFPAGERDLKRSVFVGEGVCVLVCKSSFFHSNEVAEFRVTVTTVTRCCNIRVLFSDRSLAIASYKFLQVHM